MFFADEQLGPRQSLLPSGTLWCRDVVVARTGTQLYMPHEIGADADAADGDGMISVRRDETQVFHPDAIASFEGAPVVLRHPSDEVGPSNWRALSIGHMQNVRQGAPPDDDKLVADLLISDARGIAAVRNGWRAISLGYTANYLPDGGPGRMRQVDIRGNHCAVLSPDEAARCGDACMIGDAMPKQRKGRTMAKGDGAYDRLLASIKRNKRARDQVGTEAELPTTWAGSVVDPIDGRRMDMGSDPDPTAIGGELVMTLPGTDQGAYYISKVPETGAIGLYRHDPTPALKGVSSTADRAALARTMQVRAKASEPQQFAALRSINERNAAAWQR